MGVSLPVHDSCLTPHLSVSRSATADLLKGTAVLLMIQVHVMELFAQPVVFEGWWGKLSLFLGGPPTASVFMAILGYYVAASSKSAGRLILRGLKLIALGGLLNLGLNAHLLVKVVQGTLTVDPWPFVFGVDILFLAGASTILLALLRPVLCRGVTLPAATAIGIVLLSPWLTTWLTTTSDARWVLAYVAGDYWWSYFPWFPWMAYPLLGFAWQVASRQVSRGPLLVGRNAGWAMLAACVVGTAATWRFGAMICHDLPRYYHHDIRFFLWTCAVLAVWVRLHARCQAWCGDSRPAVWLKGLGRNVTLCYVAQWLLIGNLATALYKSESLLQWVLSTVAIVTVTSLFSAFLGHLYSAAKGAVGALPSGDVA